MQQVEVHGLFLPAFFEFSEHPDVLLTPCFQAQKTLLI